MKSYDRIKQERQASFELFRRFLELGENRSLEKLTEKESISIRKLRTLSTKWSWEKRANDYDSDISVKYKKSNSDKSNNEIEQMAITVMEIIIAINDTFLQINKQNSKNSVDFDINAFEHLKIKMDLIEELLTKILEVNKTTYNGYLTNNNSDSFYQMVNNHKKLFVLTHNLLTKLAGD